jgi:hypothetical protein
MYVFVAGNKKKTTRILFFYVLIAEYLGTSHMATVGVHSKENKKFYRRKNNKPRSNLVDGCNEVKINIPSKIAKR